MAAWPVLKIESPFPWKLYGAELQLYFGGNISGKIQDLRFFDNGYTQVKTPLFVKFSN